MANRSPHLIVCLVAAAVAAAMAFPIAASAAPLANKRAEAERIKAQIDALDERMDVAVEDYNEARLAYARTQERVAQNRVRMRELEARTVALQVALEARVDSMYRSGPLALMDVLLGAASFEDFATTWDLLEQLNAADAASVAELRSARAEAAALAVDLEASRVKAKSQLAAVTRTKASIEADLARRAQLLRGVEAEIAQLMAEARARAIRASRRGSRGQASAPGGWDWGSPTNAPRGAVVGIARRYLGRPYRWAAAGPGAFDCSGFTMFVYAQVGVRLPHSSRAQISSGQRVSRANLQPGDLVFFGRPIHHVGIYVGDGMFVHSPRTGDVVSVDPLLRDFSGASRP